jgi:5-(carboxyamino)imidazole ribonucleotide synthase
MKNRIGIVGGGQLGRMLTLAAKPLGFHVLVLDPTPQSPAGQVADKQIIADFTDEAAIRQLASESDFLTFEIELANADILDELSKNGLSVNPSAQTLNIIKDKFKQKEFLIQARVPVARFKSVETVEDIETAAQEYGYPLLLKARKDAYDGRGNALIKNLNDIAAALNKLADRDLYVEEFVDFDKELAVMVARNTKGDIKTYPVVETIHKNNICHTVLAPAPVEPAIQSKAEQLARQVMEHLQGAGVFGIEMFLDKEGKVLVNEIAPRVHNSGHHTIESCLTSQFEQHIRAVTNMSLGSTEMIKPAAVMVNVLGDRKGLAQPQGLDQVKHIPNTTVHIYGKIETRPERKMGHVTVVGEDLEEALQRAKQARELIKI